MLLEVGLEVLVQVVGHYRFLQTPQIFPLMVHFRQPLIESVVPVLGHLFFLAPGRLVLQNTQLPDLSGFLGAFIPDHQRAAECVRLMVHLLDQGLECFVACLDPLDHFLVLVDMVAMPLRLLEFLFLPLAPFDALWTGCIRPSPAFREWKKPFGP